MNQILYVCAYRWSVAKRCIEWLCVGVEEVLDIVETLHLEFLWFLLDHFPVKHKQCNQQSAEYNNAQVSCIFLHIVT